MGTAKAELKVPGSSNARSSPLESEHSWTCYGGGQSRSLSQALVRAFLFRPCTELNAGGNLSIVGSSGNWELPLAMDSSLDVTAAASPTGHPMVTRFNP